ncbi:glycosyltransferase family 2 protein [Flavobacterium cellulosilyticum]|uniref:Glycosyltransferase family 2 protein n=1 Tax=Flavobacterium cellulosilyticum TaxID=2541731 RepID=A0A4R5CC44_9FLAO|nr:glycosyltransferase family 2 protein [Flavobacterium cellulosilyticum]TDD94672.1 glycosyltransferase family 2 protein [Flavobacterium cellulosilyticum]
MITPLISIIIPAYNASDFILETLESVKQQTYTNWEIVLVNDCSTDNTIDIVNEFSGNVSNYVKLIINQTNLGVSETRNVAVANASGSWLALLDSDDVWLPNHLETLINEVAKDSDLNLVYAGCLVFLDDVKNIIFEQVITDGMLNNFNISLFTHQIGINPCTVLLNKKSWNRIGGMVPNLHHAEDKDLLFRLAKMGTKFKFSKQNTALYRKHSNAIAASNNASKMALGSIYVYEKHFDWEAIPLKIRIDQLADAYLSYARLIRHIDIKIAGQYSLKALKTKKSIKNVCYFIAFKTLSFL